MLKQALLYSVSSKYSSTAIQLVSTVILARLITPQEIGVYTVASLLVGFAQFFRDFGIPDYLIKEKEMDERKASAALTLMIIISFSLCAILIALSGSIAHFYQKPDLQYIVCILSISFLLIPFGSNSMTLCRRELNFKPILIANISSSFVNALVAVSLVYSGFSYYGLAIASVSGTLVLVLVMSCYRSFAYSLSFNRQQFKSIAKFGASVGGTNLIAYIGDSFFQLFAGKYIGMEALGLFSRAKSTVTIFSRVIIDGVKPIISPYFAKTNREDGNLVESYCQSTKYIIYLALPFCLGMYVAAEDVVTLLYGTQWLLAVPFLKLLVLEYLCNCFSIFADYIVVSLGYDKKFFTYKTTQTVLRVCCVLILYPYGIDAVIYGWISVSLLRLVWTHVLLKEIIGLSVGNFYASLCKPLISFLVFSIGLLPYLIFSHQDLVTNFGLLLLTIPGYLAVMYYMEKDGAVRFLSNKPMV